MVSARPPPRPPSGWMGICAPPRHASAARTTAARWRLLLTHCSAAGAPHQELPAEGPSPQTVGWDPEAGAKAVDARCQPNTAGGGVAGGGLRTSGGGWGSARAGWERGFWPQPAGAAATLWGGMWRMGGQDAVQEGSVPRRRLPVLAQPQPWGAAEHPRSSHASGSPPAPFGLVAPNYFPTAHKAVGQPFAHIPAVPLPIPSLWFPLQPAPPLQPWLEPRP